MVREPTLAAQQDIKHCRRDILQNVFVETEIHGLLLELAILLLELPHMPQFTDAQFTVTVLPPVEPVLGNACPADQFSNRRSRLRRLQHMCNLNLGKPAFPNGPLLVQSWLRNRKTLVQTGRRKRWNLPNLPLDRAAFQPFDNYVVYNHPRPELSSRGGARKLIIFIISISN